jgi:hypothetical protein
MSEALRWALIDLLRVSDAAHGGRLHTELARIARTLGVEIIPPPAPVPVDPVQDPPGGALEDNDDQGNALAGLLELLDALWPAAQNPHGFRADQIAERMIDHGLGLDAQALGLRGLLDAIGPCPLNTVTGFTVGQRLRLATDKPVVVEGAVLVLRKRRHPGGSHLAANYRIEREPRP